MTQHSTPARAGERGMTLIELLVAMFIFAIVMAMMLRTLGDATNTKSSVQLDTSSAQAIDATVEQLATDLRMAVNPNRDLATPKQLLLGAMGTTDLRDVLVATPFELRFVADVVPSTPTYECVTYRVDVQGSLWRAISSDTFGCNVRGAFLLDLRRMMTGDGVTQNESADRARFMEERSYVHVGGGPSPAASFKYVVLQRTAANDLCAGATFDSVDGVARPADLARLVSVNIIAYDTRGRADTLAKVPQVYDDTITIRSHSTLRHRMDIGCGSSDQDS